MAPSQGASAPYMSRRKRAKLNVAPSVPARRIPKPVAGQSAPAYSGASMAPAQYRGRSRRRAS